ncbi:BTB and MATH domain-containing protein 40 [Parelaphostrongylus tenuis]|uniref:BTB and MATH domain-containing protein 40 n=1 Tax=Parelaphostrongylus tenuis TaxID=148309 RepID=A0AAD5N7I3_PARTN|nr:BTB and MATH domain-containing protein 40 [Parelaphostrongylus tenuis]
MRKSASSFANCCITNVEPVLLTQRWTVNNFSSLLKLSQPGLCLRSSVFKYPTMPDACWQLCLYPGGKRPENANNVSLFLKMSATSPLKEVVVKAEYRFFFLDDDDEIKFSNVNIGDFHAKPPKGGHSWGLRNIPRQKVQNSIRADHSLVISCTIELLPDAGRIPCRRIEPSTMAIAEMVEVSRAYVDNELAMFTGDGSSTHSDLNVTAGSGDDRVVFAVHKYKLISHSDVFRAMLEHNMEESKTNMIMIEDFSAVAVKIMLLFIYTGSISLQDLELEDASDVMQLAEKYNIPALKTMCEQELISRVCCTNVVTVWNWLIFIRQTTYTNMLRLYGC